MAIIIGSDNNGFQLKEILINRLKQLKVKYQDIGVHSSENEVFYPSVAKELCNEVIRNNYSKRGILVCGTGIGMAITANKFNGIRAAVCHDYYSAERSILSNNINVLCMGANVIGYQNAIIILEHWLNLEFNKESLSATKLNIIHSLEKENFKEIFF